MRIAVVGGGAAGIAATWLLAPAHRVTLFEAAPMLGGHIRTVGGNVRPNGPAGFDPARPLEAGVVEFDRSSFGCFTALMRALDVELRPVTLGTSLYRPDGAWHSPSVVRRARQPWRWRLGAFVRSAPLAPARLRFDRRARRADPAALAGVPMADWLPDGPLGDWMRALMTYAWSVPYARTRAIPAAFGVPVLRHFLCDRPDWVTVVGGVSTWIERAIGDARRHGAQIHTATPVHAIRRCHDVMPMRQSVMPACHDAIEIESSAGRTQHDAVVIATTPGHVLRLLVDADGDEVRRFGAWRDHATHTLVHRDRAFLDARGVVEPSAFDLFVENDRGGYNALLDTLCGYPRDGATHFGLALGIDHMIDPAGIIHRQPHVAPLYTVDAFAQRDAVIAHNGHRDTWIAGAWLGDGLHEGAIASAARVSAALGGRRLTPLG